MLLIVELWFLKADYMTVERSSLYFYVERYPYTHVERKMEPNQAPYLARQQI